MIDTIRHQPDWSAVIDWFGYRPMFHDAEVLSVELRRAPEASVIRVHVWHVTSEIDEAGYSRTEKHAVVSFTFNDIIDLQFAGWNHQNVLSEIIEQNDPDGFRLFFREIFGVEGFVIANRLSIEIEAYQKG